MPSGRLYAWMRLSVASFAELRHKRPVAADCTLHQALVREPVQPRSLPSPGAAAKTRVRSRGPSVSTKRRSSAASSSSGVPMPTNPEQLTTSPSRINAIASSAVTILSLHGSLGVRRHSSGQRVG